MVARTLRIGLKRSRGVALLMLVIIVAMGMLYFLTQQLEDISIFERAARSDPGSSNSALTQAREALLGYAVTYRDDHPTEVFGYLPCPDRDGDGIADPNSDGFCASSDGNAEIGLLPYKTLGLPDLRDAQGGCLWYAVAGNFKAHSGSTKPIMNWDTQGQFSILGSDAVARIPAPDVSGGEGGAAAVVFAAGSPIGTQHRVPTGSLPCQLNMRSVNPDTSVNPNPSAVADYLDGNYNFAVTTTIPITQGIVKDSSGNIANNDLLVWITPKQIFDRIKKRSDFATAINALSSSLVTSLTPTTPGAALASHDAGDATAVGSTKLVGKFPAATSVPSNPVDYQAYRDNWRDMYRYVRCTPSSPTNKCLTVNGQSCMGTLIFAAQSTTSGPRITADKADAATYIDTGNFSAYSTTAANTFTGAASFAMADPAQLATQDVLYCLNSQDLTYISGTSGFSATAGSSALVSSLDSSGRLGTTTTSGSDRSGCAWTPTAVDFLNGLSVYFKLNINTRDAGLTFVLADSTANPSTTNLCGGIGSSGQYLGYAGTHASGNRIKAPKIGLELDTRRDATLATDPDFAVTLLNRHAAIVYWGTTASNDDDNTHGAGTLGSSTQPLNPKVAPGIASQSFSNGSVYHVRLDIVRSYAAPTGTYTMNAYIYQNGTYLGCTPFLSDLNDDASNHCTALISNTISINDSLTAGNEAMKKVYLGFTTGQRAGRSQDITIGNFAAQNH